MAGGQLTPELVVASSPVIIMGGDVHGGYRVNFITENISRFGYTVREIIMEETPFPGLLHPGDRERIAREFESAAGRGAPSAVFDYRILTREGEVRWVEERAVFHRDSSGKAFAYQSNLLDVTEKKTAELRKARAAESLARLFRAARVSSWEYSPVTDIVSGSDYGPIFRLEGENWQTSREAFFNLQLAAPENDRAKEAWRRFMAGETPFLDAECLVNTAEGAARWFSFKAFPVKDGEGRIVKVQGLTMDISELKKAQIEGESRNRRLAQICSLASAFLEERDPAALLKQIVVKACGLAATEHGLISVYREKENDFLRVYGSGLFAPAVNTTQPADSGVFGEILKSRRRVVIRDYKNYANRLKDPRFTDIATLAAIPFFQGGVFKGILSLAYSGATCEADDDLLGTLDVFAAGAAIALRNAALYEDSLKKIGERRQVREHLRFNGRVIRAAAEGGGFLVSLDNKEKALEFSLRSLVDATDALGAYLYRVAEAGTPALKLLARYARPDAGGLIHTDLDSLPWEGPLADALGALKRGEIHIGPLEAIAAGAGAPRPSGRALWCIGAPVFFEASFWGFLGLSFEEEARAARAMDEDVLRTAAHNMAASVMGWESEKELLAAYEKLNGTFGDAIRILGQIVGRKDPYTALHQERVSLLALKTGIEMGLRGDRLDGLRIAGLVHDVGKVEIPGEILSKPGRLSPLEFNLVKTHAESGYEVLKEIDFPWPVAEITRQHHERLDGSGYPGGLAGDQIMTEARILAVTDVVEAMASHRPYRPSLGVAAAIAEIQKNSGILYDPQAAAACVRVIREDPGILSPR